MPGPTTLLLFGEPRLVFRESDGCEIPAGGRRLIAYAALHRCHLDRRHAAGTLWPACDDVRAAGNLRSALWRLRAAGITVLESDKRQVWLHPGVTVDADQVAAWALRLIGGGPASDRDEAAWHRSRPGLLPGWPDEWVGPYRERLRQRVLHAMEARASALLTAGDLDRALAAARLLTAAEPRRATAHRLLAAVSRAAAAR
ncbi:BTAD domain-containing putative transcriptional regulator [Actinoplanes sp. NPDC051411]|uniref:AfsR/SARP family transcriptional regulator n=1 Tax=Actinoplanes sp. NPDC051411 TaxID=3155522 RepID=UPI00341F6213